MLRTIGKSDPCRFRATKARTHMVEYSPLSLDPRLFGASEEEVGIRIAKDGSGQAYSFSPVGAGAGWSPACCSGASSVTAFRFTALVLPGRSCSRS